MDFDGTLNVVHVVFEDAGIYSCFQHGVEQNSYVLAIESQEHKKRVRRARGKMAGSGQNDKLVCLYAVNFLRRGGYDYTHI